MVKLDIRYNRAEINNAKFDFQIILLYIAGRTACRVLTHSPSTAQFIINIVCKSPVIRYPY